MGLPTVRLLSGPIKIFKIQCFGQEKERTTAKVAEASMILFNRQTCQKARTQSHGSNSPLLWTYDCQVETASQSDLAVFF